MRQGMNEVPSLVSFERQTTLRTGMQHRTPTHWLPLGLRLTRLCCIAKAGPNFAISATDGPPTTKSLKGGSRPGFRHVTTLRVNHLFTRPNGPHSPLKGTLGTPQLLTRMARFTLLTKL
jgi:hypothetical protein